MNTSATEQQLEAIKGDINMFYKLMEREGFINNSWYFHKLFNKPYWEFLDDECGDDQKEFQQGCLLIILFMMIHYIYEQKYIDNETV